jgi:DNA-binding transcriptional regulator YdaS (Cro superfamily)
MSPTKTISPFAAWMAAATPSEQEYLADQVETSRATLYQYSSGHRTCSAERGADIERVTREMAKTSKGRLSVVLRTDLVPACRACPYAQKCLGDDALRSHFPVVVQG